MSESRAIRYMLVAQAFALLFSATTWWRVWQCPCESTLQDAAFWTALVIAQAVVLAGLSALHSK